MRFRAAGRAGFTLLETMVALAVLGLVVIALLQLVAGATATTAKDRSYTEAMALAEQRMEALLAGGGEAALRADGENQSFSAPFERYRSRIRAARVPGRSLVENAVRVSWDHGGGGEIELVTRTSVEEGAGTGDAR